MIYDSSSSTVQQFVSDLSKEQPATRAPAGFAESFFGELQNFWRENLSISRLLATDPYRAERAQRIREIAGDEAFIRALTTPGDPKTQAMIEQLAAEHPEDIQSDEAIAFNVQERFAALRQEHDEALKRQTAMGKVGGFLGTMTGAMSDPIVLGTLPLGASWATGILRTMLIEAGINAGTELAIQAPVYRFKQEIESPYTLTEAVENIAAAGIGAAALSGLIKAGAKGVRRLAGWDDLLEATERVSNPTGEQREAIRVLRDYVETLRQSPFEANPVGDELHLRAMAKASDDIATGRPVDLDGISPPARADEALSRELPVDVEGELVSTEAIEQRVQEILARDDVQLRLEDGSTRSAREVLGELDSDERAAKTVLGCLLS